MVLQCGHKIGAGRFMQTWEEEMEKKKQQVDKNTGKEDKRSLKTHTLQLCCRQVLQEERENCACSAANHCPSLTVPIVTGGVGHRVGDTESVPSGAKETASSS